MVSALIAISGQRKPDPLFRQTSVSLIVANLSVVVAFLFRINTEETSTFSPKELKSIITFGSQPIRLRAQRDSLQPTTVVGIETTTVILDDFGTYPQEAGKRPKNHDDAEADTSPMPVKRALLSDLDVKV